MIGKPKYDYGETVCFKVNWDGNPRVITGTIEIIDRFGTFEDDSDVSYDIYVEAENMLYKHINEKAVFKPVDNTQDNQTEKS